LPISSPLAHATVRLAPELTIANPTPAPQRRAQPPDAVASGGTDFLIAWPGSADRSVRSAAGVALLRLFGESAAGRQRPARH